MNVAPALAWRGPLQGAPWRGLAVVLLLGVGLAVMRALATLGPAVARPLLPLGFVIMALTPWLLLRGPGRRAMGLVLPLGSTRWAAALASGMALALACCVCGTLLYGHGEDHWLVSLAQSFRQAVDVTDKPLALLFVLFTGPALLFSPIGEELFFRGLLQRALEDVLPARLALAIECSAFACVHLCHHGLFWQAGGWAVRTPSGWLWAGWMLLAAWLFGHWRQASGSVLPAMVAHAGFNAAMSAYLFAVVWPALA